MIRKRVNPLVFAVTLAGLTSAVGTASADVVTHTGIHSTVPTTGKPSGSFAGPALPGRGDLTRFIVSLDLGSYRDAAVSFDFASLLGRDPRGFSASSATGMSYLDGFRLLEAEKSKPVVSAGGGVVRSGRPTGFRRLGDTQTFATAMFNLSAYDGQTVLLSVAFDDRMANRRGIVNVENLKIEVRPTGTSTAAAIPEPNSLALFLIALLGLSAWRADGTWRSKFRFLPRASDTT